jgi:MerR family transcriptional regulator, copper efflux regulator
MDKIRKLLSLWQMKSRSSAAVKKIAGAHIDGLKDKVAELVHHCRGDHRPECPILEDLAA